MAEQDYSRWGGFGGGPSRPTPPPPSPSSPEPEFVGPKRVPDPTSPPPSNGGSTFWGDLQATQSAPMSAGSSPGGVPPWAGALAGSSGMAGGDGGYQNMRERIDPPAQPSQYQNMRQRVMDRSMQDRGFRSMGGPMDIPPPQSSGMAGGSQGYGDQYQNMRAREQAPPPQDNGWGRQAQYNQRSQSQSQGFNAPRRKPPGVRYNRGSQSSGGMW